MQARYVYQCCWFLTANAQEQQYLRNTFWHVIDACPASMASKTEICSPDRRYEHSRFKIYYGPYICKHTFTAFSDMYTFVIVMVEIK